MKGTILICALAALTAQEPTGMIEGVIRDPSGALVGGASVKAENTATHQISPAIASDDGRYAIPRLPAGVYAVSVSVPGFQTSLKTLVVVETGTTTSVDFSLNVGEITNAVTVAGALPLLLDDSASVGGTITPDFIQHIPLNGRSVLEFGKTSAGVREATRSFNRSLLDIHGAPQGTPGRGSRYTTDGVSNMAIGNGGSVMNFSTEAIREDSRRGRRQRRHPYAAALRLPVGRDLQGLRKHGRRDELFVRRA